MSPTTDYWKPVKDRLQETMETYVFNNWIARIGFASYENGKLTVEVPSEFFRGWITDNYLELINQACSETMPGFVAIEIAVNARIEQLCQETEIFNTQRQSQSLATSKAPQAQPQQPDKPRNWLIDRFVDVRITLAQPHSLRGEIVIRED